MPIPKSPTLQELKRLQLDLELRTKELKAKEEYLAQREQFLEDGPLTLKILEEKLKAREKQLEQFEASATETKRGHTQQIDDLIKRINEKLRQAELGENHLRVIARDTKELERRYDLLDSEIRGIDKEKKDADVYLKQQEKIIADTIDEGNATLKGINLEIKSAQRQFDGMKSQIAEAESKLTESRFKLIQADAELEKYREEVETSHISYEKTLVQEQTRLAQEKEKANKVIAEVDDKMRILKAKEQSLLTIQESIRRERAELEQDKHHWNSEKSLYDID